MDAHEHHAKAKRVVVCAVLTVSDTRTAETDTSGTCIQALLEQAGHRVASYTILPDEPARVRAHVEGVRGDPEGDVVILNGGTGLAPGDRTYEPTVDLLGRQARGLGEPFRMATYPRRAT